MGFLRKRRVVFFCGRGEKWKMGMGNRDMGNGYVCIVYVSVWILEEEL